MILFLFEDEAEFCISHEQIIVGRNLEFIDFTITVICSTSSFLFALFSLNGELSPRVSFLIIRDVNWDHIFNLLYDCSYVLDTYFTCFIALDE